MASSKTPQIKVLLEDLQQSALCASRNCSRANSEAFSKVRQQLERDALSLALSHGELVQIQRLVMEKTPDLSAVIDKISNLLSKPAFRADIAKMVDKYNDLLIKPSAEKDHMMKEIQCFMDNKCSVDDLRKIIALAKAVIDFGLDAKVNRSWMNALKSQSKAYTMFLKLTGK